jgi:hypothetical protein
MMMETSTPTITPSERADLLKRAKPAAELGLPPEFLAGRIPIDFVSQINGSQTVTLPLYHVPTSQPFEAGGQYGVPVVSATVNGHTDVRVLLDSGSNRNLFGQALARTLDVPAIAEMGPAVSTGIGGTVENFYGVVASIQLDSLEMRRLIALIGPDTQVLNFTHGFWNNPQVMITGINTYRSLSYLTIDAPNGTATFSPKETFEPRKTDTFRTATPLRWENDLPTVDIQIDGHSTSCVLDTGGDYGVLLPRDFAQQLGYWKPGHEKLGTSSGVAGTALSANYNVREAKIGNATFVQFPARTEINGPEVAGGHALLGNICLRRLRVTFDFQRKLLWLER